MPASDIEVRDKYTGQLLGAVPGAGPEDVDRAVAAAVSGARTMARWPAWRRAELLQRTAAALREAREPLARLIAGEAGKALAAARVEVERAATTFGLAGEEARRIHGETVPLDAVPSGEGYWGFWTRRPVGVVAAVTPFNFPLNLVAHKVAPALAAGNSVVLKPATATPLTAVELCRLLSEAGAPEGAVNLLCGEGRSVGGRLVSDPRVRKVSFTGSVAVGRAILAQAGVKRVTLELGNTSPVVVEDADDLEAVARRCAGGAFAYAGQVCISVQRLYVRRALHDRFLEALVAAAEATKVGPPLEEGTVVGPMIDEAEARRVEEWVAEARAAGARVCCGGRREGAVHWPTVLAEARDDLRLCREEAFGPVVAVMPYDAFDEALARANDTPYGLQAGVFVRDVDRVLAAVRALDFGGVVVNDVPTFRADHQPYGGCRESGLGREGARYAVEEMTDVQMVAIRERRP